jgi:cytoskeleton protein RodZ
MSATDTDPMAPADPPRLGARLRAAREARGMDVATAAAALRVRSRIVEAIERDDLEALGAPVFARGYLCSYARMLGLPPLVVDGVCGRPEASLAPLQTTVHVPRSRIVAERLARKGAYLVLTVSLVAPFVYYATQDQLPVHELGLRSLDAPVEPSSVAAAPAPQPFAAGFENAGEPAIVAAPAPPADSAVPAAEPPADGDVVMASMASFPRAPAARASDVAGGWQLSLREDSWVEIVDVDGRRLEYGLLRAGSERRYAPGRIAMVSLGNARGVRVQRDGESLDLGPFQRANVARFTVSSDGRLRPAGS